MTSSAFKPSLQLRRRRVLSTMFRIMCSFFTYLSVAALAILLYRIGEQGFAWLDSQFLNSLPSRFPEKAGIKTALWGTIWLVSLTAHITVPLGIASALYLEEYTHKGRLSTFIEVNIANLAGVPSIVYGMLGLTVFVRWLGAGHSVLSGALTISLLILPVVITAAREAIRAVPSSIRKAAYGVGATRWQIVRAHVLPAALPGIVTGVILALSRAIGETAPLILVGAAVYIGFVPEGPMSDFSVLPLQIYDWASRPNGKFHELAAAGIIVLLGVLLCMNTIAVFIRHRFQRNYS